MKTVLWAILGVLAGLAVSAACSPLIYASVDRLEVTEWPLVRVWPLGAITLLLLPWPIGWLLKKLAERLSGQFGRRTLGWTVGLWGGFVLGTLFITVPSVTAVPALPAPSSTHVRVVDRGHDYWPYHVYFLNGSDAISPAERTRLLLVGRSLAECGVGEIEIRGYASSAEYAEQNEERNLGLAERRATRAAEVLRKVGLVATVRSWPGGFVEMAKARGYTDIGQGGHRRLAVEKSNRRAEARAKGEIPCEPN